MPLGRFLVAREVIDAGQLAEARRHQKIAGGPLMDSLQALGFSDAQELDAVLGETPAAPEAIEETGLDAHFLLAFVLKATYMTGFETAPQLADYVKLPDMIVEEVLHGAKEKQLVEVLGLADPRSHVYRWALTGKGRDWALDALEQCQYTGPAPVPLDRFREQVVKQTIARDRIDPDSMADAFTHLVLPDGTVERLGPAANSGRALLLYGAPGNGKTSLAEAIGSAFRQTIFVPHCLEVSGQIIRVFDPALHEPAPLEEAEAEGADARWVRCQRPVIITGGELTMEMLDLSFDPVAKYYEAPAHVKALGGVFIIDDFGRQRMRPQDLVNRWIMPLERRVDYLTLHTGKKLEMPFDQLIVFSTNYPPADMMDEAALRRIPYKFEVAAPTAAQYEAIFRRLCRAHQMEVPSEIVAYLLESFYPTTSTPISAAHPKFLIEHVLERCRFEGFKPGIGIELVREAAANLLVEGEPPPVSEDRPPPRRTRARTTHATTRRRAKPAPPEGE